MDNSEFEEFSDEEKTIINNEYKRQKPSIGLEDKTVDQLRLNGLFLLPGFRPLRSALFTGMSILCLTIAFFLGRNFGPAPRELTNKNLYMLLLYGPEVSTTNASHAVEYGEWFHGLESKQIYGEELRPNGWHLEKGSIAESDKKNNVQGYFIVAASSDSEALAIALTCPHVKYNGTIEVRPIKTTN